MGEYFFQIVWQVVFLLNILFAVLIVFYERRNPAVTWAWLMVLMFLPYVGFFVYLLFGLDSKRYRVFGAKSKEDDKIHDKCAELDFAGLECLRVQEPPGKRRFIEGHERLNDLINLNRVAGNGALTDNNAVTCFFEGEPMFESLLAEIKRAKDFIHIQYYIVRGDDLGRRVCDALTAKAAEGVEVRFLLDGMGTALTPNSMFRPLTNAGGQVAFFLPPTSVRINFRNHRKLCIIDGRVGYIGGLNIGNEYLGKSKRFGFWRDSHIKIVGDAVKQLEMRFIMDWNFCGNHNMAAWRRGLALRAWERMPLSEKYFPKLPRDADGINMQIVSSGPDTKWASIAQSYMKMITEADKTVYIATPYFVPDDGILQALRIAALSGIDVRIMIPAHPDHPFVLGASMSYLGELLRAGVKCYKYERGFLHSKLLLIDGIVSSVGTANMDVRSFKLNFEINAFIYDEDVTRKFEELFLADLSDCTLIDRAMYEQRTRRAKIKESVSRLISPLL